MKALERIGVSRRPSNRDLIALAIGLVGALVLLGIVPAVSTRSDRDTLFTLLTFAALAQSWNIIGGFGGQFSLGNAAFVGIGSYTAAVLFIHTGLPLALVVPASGLTAAIFATVTAVGLFRLRGVYFAIGSLALALAAYSWMVNWDYTGATQGLSLPFDDLPDEQVLYTLAASAVLVTTAVSWSLTKTRFGLRLQAVRDDEEAAIVAGVNASRVKLIAFAISAFMTGVVGALIAMRQIFIDPNAVFSLDWTIDMIVMTIVGGIGTVLGPVIGAIVVFYGIEKQLEGSPEVSALLTGVLLVIVVRFAPGGVWGLLVEGADSLRRRLPGGHEPATPASGQTAAR